MYENDTKAKTVEKIIATNVNVVPISTGAAFATSSMFLFFNLIISSIKGDDTDNKRIYAINMPLYLLLVHLNKFKAFFL